MLKPACFAIALALLGTSTVAQNSVDLTMDQARVLARQAVLADDPALALQVAEAILAEVPDDRASLLVVAAAAPRVGDPARGRIAGARAWSQSTLPIQKYEAARLTALAAANEERFTLATFWLRRALTVAPNDQERARTLADARAVTRLNPWSSSLSFSLNPSNNVNGGAEDDDLFIDGEDTGGQISEDAQALKGWRASLSTSTQFRFHQNAQSRSHVGLSYQGTRVKLSEDTEVTEESLRNDMLRAFVSHERAVENGVVSATLSHATTAYRRLDLSSGDSAYESYDLTALTVGRRFTVSDTTSASVSVTRDRLDYSRDNISVVDRISVSGGLSFRRQNNDRVSLNLQLRRAVGDNDQYTARDQTISLSYSWADPIGFVSLSAGAGITQKHYPDYRVFDVNAPGSSFGAFVPLDGGRNDTTNFLNLNIGFPQVEYAGFVPGVRIDAARTRSNYGFADTKSLSAGFTISSAF
jgi:hypothetical protein